MGPERDVMARARPRRAARGGRRGVGIRLGANAPRHCDAGAAAPQRASPNTRSEDFKFQKGLPMPAGMTRSGM